MNTTDINALRTIRRSADPLALSDDAAFRSMRDRMKEAARRKTTVAHLVLCLETWRTSLNNPDNL